MTSKPQEELPVYRITAGDIFIMHGSIKSELRSAVRFVRTHLLKLFITVLAIAAYVALGFYCTQFSPYMPAIFVAIAEVILSFVLIALAIMERMKKLAAAGKPKTHKFSGARRV